MNTLRDRKAGVLEAAAVIWRYLQLVHEPEYADFILCLGGNDPGVARHAASLWHHGVGVPHRDARRHCSSERLRSNGLEAGVTATYHAGQHVGGHSQQWERTMINLEQLNKAWTKALRDHAVAPLEGRDGPYRAIGDKSLAFLDALWEARKARSRISAP
jgi:hypothetical protein